jgi:hypothetical protein
MPEDTTIPLPASTLPLTQQERLKQSQSGERRKAEDRKLAALKNRGVKLWWMDETTASDEDN